MLEINNLYFSYTGNCPYILNDINLLIDDGDYVSIIGENGCGKSTLIKIVLNLLKPLKGTVKVNTDKIGYVPQCAQSFNSEFPITVYEVLRCHAKTKKIDAGSIGKYLDLVGMCDYKKSLIGDLSGGQEQKIFIARALMGSPELLILDEPSTGIDMQSQKDIYGILKSLNEEKKITIVSVEHNAAAVAQNSKHLFCMKNGGGKMISIKEYVESEGNMNV